MKKRRCARTAAGTLSPIDFEQKWNEGSVLYNPKTDELIVVFGIYFKNSEKPTAAVLYSEGLKYMQVCSVDEPGVTVWDHVGSL